MTNQKPANEDLTEHLEYYTDWNAIKLGLISIETSIPEKYKKGWKKTHSTESETITVACRSRPNSIIPHGLSYSLLIALALCTVVQDKDAGDTVTIPLKEILDFMFLSPELFEAVKDILPDMLYSLKTADYDIKRIPRDARKAGYTERDINFSLLNDLHILKQTTGGNEEIIITYSLNKILWKFVKQARRLHLNRKLLEKLTDPTAHATYFLFELLRLEEAGVNEVGNNLEIKTSDFVIYGRLFSPVNI